MPLSLRPPTIAEIVREGWGTRARFQKTHELSMGASPLNPVRRPSAKAHDTRVGARGRRVHRGEGGRHVRAASVGPAEADDVDVLSPQDEARNADTAFDDDADDGDGDYQDDAADTRSAYASSQWPTVGTHWQDRVDDGSDSAYYKDVEPTDGCTRDESDSDSESNSKAGVETEEDRHERLYWEAREGVPKPVYECEVCGDASATYCAHDDADEYAAHERPASSKKGRFVDVLPRGPKQRFSRRQRRQQRRKQKKRGTAYGAVEDDDE